jgi:hypothetical protein
MIRRLALLTLLWSLAPGAAAQGPDPAASYPEREFAASVYLWGAKVEGTVEADGASVDFEESFSEILEQFDLGVMLAAGGRFGRLVALFDGIWIQLADERDTGTIRVGPATLGPAEIDADIDQAIADLKLGYRLIEPEPRARNPFSVDLLAGARYWYMKTEIEADFAVIPDLSSEESGSWVDPIVGVRVVLGLGPRLQLFVIGDVGGWGAGEASDHTWQAMAMLGIALSDAWNLRLGYRALDFERGPSDYEMRGPIVGAVYRF